MTPFLNRSIRPDPEPFTLAELSRNWTCPIDAEARREQFDAWSAGFDAGRVDRREHYEGLLWTANIPDEIERILG